MAIETSQVFLVPGQRVSVGEGGALVLSPAIENRVVIANTAQDAQTAIEAQEPEFKPLGFTSLEMFEDAVVKLRQALNGHDNGWPLIVAPGML